MKRNLSSKLKLELETIIPLVMDHVVGGNGAAGFQTSCVPACTQGTQGTGGGGTRITTTGGPQSSPIHTCLPSANCLP
jgi:hypothetical protein